MPASAQARSGNPSKRAAAKKAAPAPRKQLVVSSVDDWGSDEGELVEFPSGKVVRIERIPLATLIAENLLGDSLSVLAAKAVESGQGMSQSETQEIAKDPAKIAEAMDAFDKVAARAILEPSCRYYKYLSQAEIPEGSSSQVGQVVPREERSTGVLYTDRIDIEDKIFLFQVVSGGTTDLQRFREQYSESLAGISAS